ncbi:MAG: type VI immunity family protein [Minicystis sp.]
MSTLLDKDDADLSEILCVRDDEGRVALRIGLLATMFVAEPWTRAARERVAEAADAYVDEFREHLRWSENPKTGRMLSVRKRKIVPFRDWLPQHPEGKMWGFGFTSGEEEDAAGEFQINAYGADEGIGKDPAYVQIYLPLNWFAEHPGTFRDFVLSFAKRLRPLSGYAGIGILESLNAGDRLPFQRKVRQIAERFPGLEIESKTGSTLHTGEGIKGVNWLTILGDRWIKEIGGADYLKLRLGDDFPMSTYEGGLMIQAGPKPQIGDAEKNQWPRHYVTLAKVLKPIQIKRHYPFHFGGEGHMDAEASNAWLNRFDGK